MLFGLVPCAKNEFKCLNSVYDCHNIMNICDNVEDCLDGFDEEYCDKGNILRFRTNIWHFIKAFR